MVNFDEALAEVRKQLGADCVITSITTRPYGWVFCYTSRQHVETGDERYGLIGNAPFFISKWGQVERISTATNWPPNLFFKNWEAAHPEYELPKCEEGFLLYDSALTLSEDDEKEIIRILNTVLWYAIGFKTDETRFQVDGGKCRFRVQHRIGETWQRSLLGNYYALIAQRLKQMAKIEPRDKEHLDATQSGTFHVTLKDENYLIKVTSTMTENGEELHLKTEPQA